MSHSGRWRNWGLLFMLAVAVLAMAAPLLWTIILSLKPNSELMRGTQTALLPP